MHKLHARNGKSIWSKKTKKKEIVTLLQRTLSDDSCKLKVRIRNNRLLAKDHANRKLHEIAANIAIKIRYSLDFFLARNSLSFRTFTKPFTKPVRENWKIHRIFPNSSWTKFSWFKITLLSPERINDSHRTRSKSKSTVRIIRERNSFFYDIPPNPLSS